jgi:hypothetical protein
MSPPKHRLTFNGLHGFISQKIEIFITTAIITSNPTYLGPGYLVSFLVRHLSSWRMPSSRMWRCVVLVWTDVSEERIASIFRVEKSASEGPAWSCGCRLSQQSKTPSYMRTGSPCSLQSPAHAGSSLANFSTLNMEAIRSSETSVHTRSTQHHIPEEGILYSHFCENLRSYIYHLSRSEQTWVRRISFQIIIKLEQVGGSSEAIVFNPRQPLRSRS